MRWNEIDEMERGRWHGEWVNDATKRYHLTTAGVSRKAIATLGLLAVISKSSTDDSDTTRSMESDSGIQTSMEAFGAWYRQPGVCLIVVAEGSEVSRE